MVLRALAPFFLFLVIIHDFSRENPHVLYRPVAGVGGHFLDFFHDVHAFHHLAEDSILSVEMGSAAVLKIVFLYILGNGIDLNVLLRLPDQLLTQGFETFLVAGFLAAPRFSRRFP